MTQPYWIMTTPTNSLTNELTATMGFDIDAFVRDNVKKMQALEDAAMLKVVIDYLHNNGYTVTKDEESDSCG